MATAKLSDMGGGLNAFAKNLKNIDRIKAIKKSSMNYARKVRRVAAGFMVASGWRNSRAMTRIIRAKPLRRGVGYVISVRPRGNKGSKGFYKNSRGDKKPVPMWMDEGTRNRRTKNNIRILGASRSAHSTGSTEAVGFMEKADIATTSQYISALVKDYEKQIKKLVRKHGLS